MKNPDDSTNPAKRETFTASYGGVHSVEQPYPKGVGPLAFPPGDDYGAMLDFMAYCGSSLAGSLQLHASNPEYGMLSSALFFAMQIEKSHRTMNDVTADHKRGLGEGAAGRSGWAAGTDSLL